MQNKFPTTVGHFVKRLSGHLSDDNTGNSGNDVGDPNDDAGDSDSNSTSSDDGNNGTDNNNNNDDRTSDATFVPEDSEQGGVDDTDNVSSGADVSGDNEQSAVSTEDQEDELVDESSSESVLTLPAKVAISRPPKANTRGWPSWVREAYDYLVVTDLGADFRYAVRHWTVIERNYAFRTSVSVYFLFFYFS